MYREGRVNEQTYAWHEDAEEWGQLSSLSYQGQTLRDICAVESAPSSRKITASDPSELSKKTQAFTSSQQDIEDRLRATRAQTTTAKLSQDQYEPSPVSSSSSGSVRPTQDSEESDLEAGWDWVERPDVTGRPVFLNVRTGITTEERPEILEEVQWLEDEKEGYIAVKVEKGKVLRLDGKPLPIDTSQLRNIPRFHKGLLQASPPVLST